jgi:RimK family alpha-L-glutamate ligase
MWVLSSKESFAMYSIKRLTEEALKAKVELEVFKSGELSFHLEPSASLKIFQADKELALPLGLLVKTGCSTITFENLSLMSALEGHARVVNTRDCYYRMGDKWTSYLNFVQASLPTPATVLLSTIGDLQRAGDLLGFPMVIKDIYGARGNSVLLVKSANDLKGIYEFFDSTKKEHSRIVAQKYIQSSHGQDVRVYIVGGRPLGAIERKSKSGELKANVSQGAEVKAFPLDGELVEISLQVCQRLGLLVGGIDFLKTDSGFLLCEVNLGAQFVGFEQATGINVAEALVKFVTDQGDA